jgi:hypothetical protein
MFIVFWKKRPNERDREREEREEEKQDEQRKSITQMTKRNDFFRGKKVQFDDASHLSSSQKKNTCNFVQTQYVHHKLIGRFCLQSHPRHPHRHRHIASYID